MDPIHVSQEEHILLIKLNRPEKYNALSIAMYHDLGRALARLNYDRELRVAVIHAEGKHFTAGVELDSWAPILGSGKPIPIQPDEIDPLWIDWRAPYKAAGHCSARLLFYLGRGASAEHGNPRCCARHGVSDA